MLTLNLKPIFKVRGIDRPYTYLVKAGFSSHVAHIILNSKTRTFRLDHIELLCKVLLCEPNDLLSFTESGDHHLSPDHPLNNLKQSGAVTDMKETLATMPLKKLKEFTEQIDRLSQ